MSVGAPEPEQHTFESNCGHFWVFFFREVFWVKYDGKCKYPFLTA